jgi:outer membrane protein, multidrug efflux system
MNRAFPALLLLAGCATQAPYEPPAVELPAAWHDAAPAPRFAEDGRWWRIYGDPQLNVLLDEALSQNSDLLLAAARVDEARALLAEARSGSLPAVDAGAVVSRQSLSQRTATSFPGALREFTSHQATLSVSYDIDLFGRIRSGTEAARAELAVSEAGREAVRLALAAEVARSYFALRALDEQIAITGRTIDLREASLKLQRRRYDAGVISEYDLRQLDAEAAAVRAQLPPLERARETEEAALAVLLGRSPRRMLESGILRTAAFGEAPGPAVPPTGLPSELLLRRPDLVAAERQLAAAHARIAVARAEMFPSIALTGALGVESAALANLFTGPAGLWFIGASVAQPIFAGGRLEARAEAAEARQRAALAQYQKTIQTAFAEVRAALAAQARSRESFDAESARAAALADTLRLARLRYNAGIASQLDVLDAERGLLAAELSRVEALRAQRSAVADLFRALGG